MELSELPIWALMQQKGCQDLIHLHRHKYGTEMPATCQGVTRPDNAIISSQLLPLVGQIQVLPPTWFATHAPVCFTLQLPKPDLFRTKLRLPASWVEFGIDQPDLQEAYNQLNQPVLPPATFEEWGQLVESVVDQAVHIQHDRTGVGPTHLPKSHRGRCQPQKIVKLPVFSSVKTARDGDYNPLFEVTTMRTRRRITQLRRLQCLHRRIAKHAKNPQTAAYCHDMSIEWNTILKSTCFGMPFYEWLAQTPECGPPRLPLPTEAWIHMVMQLVKHEVDAAVTADHAIFARKAKYAATCDRKYHNSAGAFRAVRDAPKLPITEVKVSQSQFVTLEWDASEPVAVCACEDPELFSLEFPVRFQDTMGWIIGRNEFSITIQCHEMPAPPPEQAMLHQDQVHVNPRQVANQLSKYWLPLWQKQHDIDTDHAWPEFASYMQALPQPPHEFQYDDSLTAWKTAIRNLKSKSARGFDAVSAQELKLLPDALILQLRDVCNSYPQGFPTWMMMARVCPLSKVDGTPLASQSRPICILSQVYRLYASVWCRQVLQYWASWFPAEICGMLPKRGSHSAAFGVLASLEAACFQNLPYSGVTLDLIKCFNCIRHQVGWRLLVRLGLPAERVHQWFSSISKLQRFWEIGGESYGPIEASCGFPEGDSHSVLVMLSIAMLWIYNLKKLQRPMLAASAYADNWTWRSSSVTDHAPATKVTLDTTDICGLSVDWSKTWMWASDTPTSDSMKQQLANIAPTDVLQRLHSARDLGFEVQYSGCHQVGHRAQRYESALRRLERLTHASLSLGVKEHIVQSAIFPAAFYGSEVFPVADDVLAKFRTKTAEALVGKSHAMSPSMVLLLTKPAILDPGFFVIAMAFRTTMQWLRRQPFSVQQQYFQMLSRFKGTARNVRGPASALKHYMSKFAWHVDLQGQVHVDTFLTVHLLKDSFPRMLMFLTNAWQKDLLQMMTARHSLYSLPDIARSDTVRVLTKFEDGDRKQLLREIAGAFQLETQKQHWTEDATGRCLFCDADDSKEHRLLHCPVFAETRQPFEPVLRRMEEEGLQFAQCPVISVHPEAELHRTQHFRQVAPVIADSFFDFAYRRQHAQMPFHIYVDGSCCHPHQPSTRYAAFAGVIDISHSDGQRRQLAALLLATGVMPHTLQTCFVGRAQGEQTINRAEVSALACASQLPYGFIHTDSQYAINMLHSVLTMSSLDGLHNADLLTVDGLRHVSRDRIKKIKAHRQPSDATDLLDLYHMLGNTMVDTVAKTTCKELNKAWQTQLEQVHLQVSLECEVLHEICKLHVALFKARAIAAQERSRLEDNNLPVDGKSNLQPIRAALSTWEPTVVQQLVFPCSTDWFEYFSWGKFLAEQMYLWMQTTIWPQDHGGPLEKEIGVTWLELGVSFSMYINKALPIIRKNQLGQNRLLLIEDNRDLEEHSVTGTDLAATMQKMWCQCEGWIQPESRPNVQKGLNMSLYAQGFQQAASGLTPRPKFYAQDRVAEYLAPLILKRTAFTFDCRMDWCERRTSTLQTCDWQYLSASATVNEGVDVQLSQTGTGEGDAEVSKTASATAEDTETVTKTMKVGSEGVGKLKKLFEASATAQSWVASKACISARKARSLLDSNAMQLHGIPFALAVYNKAHAVAFEKAKGKAAEMALDTAQGAAKRQVERELIAQIQSYAKEHSAELKDLAMEDAVKSTLGQKKQLEAAAMAEAFQLASEKVHKQAPLKATAEAKEEAMKTAKEEATRLATLEARKDASKSLEKKVLQKAMEDAKAKAELSAEAKAKAIARAEAEKVAKEAILKPETVYFVRVGFIMSTYMQHFAVAAGMVELNTKRRLTWRCRDVGVKILMWFLHFLLLFFILANRYLQGIDLGSMQGFQVAVRFSFIFLFVCKEVTIPFQFVYTALDMWIFLRASTSSTALGPVLFAQVFILGMTVATSIIWDWWVRSRIQAVFDTADAESLVSSFRRMLRGVCDGEVLLDNKLGPVAGIRIHGESECVKHLMFTTISLTGRNFAHLLVEEEQQAFIDFIETSTQQAADSSTKNETSGAPQCLRVSIRGSSGTRVGVDLYHVPVAGLFGITAPHHLIALKEDVDFQRPVPLPEASDDAVPSELLSCRGNEHTAPQPAPRPVPDFTVASFRRQSDEPDELSALQSGMPSMRKFVKPTDWEKIRSRVSSFAEECQQNPAIAPKAVRKLALRMPEHPTKFVSVQETFIKAYQGPAGAEAPKVWLHMKGFKPQKRNVLQPSLDGIQEGETNPTTDVALPSIELGLGCVLGPQSSASRSRGGRQSQGHEKCRTTGSGKSQGHGHCWSRFHRDSHEAPRCFLRINAALISKKGRSAPVRWLPKTPPTTSHDSLLVSIAFCAVPGTAEPMAFPAMARCIFIAAAVVCATCSKLGHHKGFLASHDVRPHRNSHIQHSQSSSTDAEDVEVTTQFGDPMAEPVLCGDPGRLRVHARPEDGAPAVDGIDIDIVKINTNMLLPSTYSVSLVTTTQAPANDRGDCVSEEGRRLRAKRQRCRDDIRIAALKPLGKRIRQTLRRKIRFLANHHSFQVTQIPFSIRSVLNMTWHCQACRVNNSDRQDRCNRCNEHWSKVWVQPKKRSRSKSQSKAQYKGQGEQGDQKEDWSIFPRTVPWVPTTPSARMARRVEAGDGAGVKEPSGAQTIVPPASSPSEIPLTAEEERVLEHLDAIQKMGHSLTDSMLKQQEELKARQQAATAVRSITHGHLNKLNKVRAQTNAAHKRVADLDREWAIFIENTIKKVKEHAALFQTCRADLLEAYNAKLAELHQLKQEMSVVTRSMFEQPQMTPDLSEPPDVAQQLQELQEVIDVDSQVGHVDLTEDMEDDEMTEEMNTSGRRLALKQPKAFRGASSPLKDRGVAGYFFNSVAPGVGGDSFLKQALNGVKHLWVNVYTWNGQFRKRELHDESGFDFLLCGSAGGHPQDLYADDGDNQVARPCDALSTRISDLRVEKDDDASNDAAIRQCDLRNNLFHDINLLEFEPLFTAGSFTDDVSDFNVDDANFEDGAAVSDELGLPKIVECASAGGDNVDPSWLSKSERRSVQFADTIQVHLFFEELNFETDMDQHVSHETLRQFWHLDGQVTNWSEMIRVLCGQSRRMMAGGTNSGVSPCEHVSALHEPPGSNSRPLASTVSMNSESTAWWWEDMRCLVQEQTANRPVFVPTWFVSPGRYPICLQYKKIKIESSDDFRSFRRRCLFAWQDFLDDQQVEFHIVEGRPPGSPTISKHVIMVQGKLPNSNFVLFHGVSLPALRRTRAVLFDQDITVRDFFVEAHFPEACRQMQARCFLRFGQSNDEHFLEDWQICDLPVAVYGEGDLRLIQDDDGDSIASEIDGESASTECPDSDSGEDVDVWDIQSAFSVDTGVLSGDVTERDGYAPSWWQAVNRQHLHNDGVSGDESFLMSGQPVMHQLDVDNPYPWEGDGLEEPEGLVFVEDVNIAFAEDHETHVEEYIEMVLQEAPNPEQQWVAITFGLGLTDLGRRDTTFTPTDLPGLLGKMHELWADFAAYADLTVYYVFW
eukprot:s764_g12.t1